MNEEYTAPTIDELRAVIDKAEQVFRKGHGFFGGTVDATTRDAVFDFQPRLAREIYSLEAEILRVKRAKQVLIEAKKRFPAKSLPGEFKKLHDYVTALERVIDYGYLVGDAFAWMFYRRESRLLASHFGHERIRHLPVGTGGLGEIEFIAQTPMIDNHLVVYHGTTTYLRLGDISLFDLKTRRIVGIAELKSQRIAEDRVQIAVNYVGQKFELPPSPPASTPAEPFRPLDQKFRSIIERQTRAIRRAVEGQRSKKQGTNPNAAGVVFSPDCLVRLYDATSAEKATTIQVSPCLALTGLKFPNSTLAERVLDLTKWENDFLLNDVPVELRRIIVDGAPDNSLQMGCLVFPSGGRYSLEYGMKPVPWWGVRKDVQSAIMDGSFMVMSFFNPAALCARLRERGYEVSSIRPGRGFSLHANIGGRRFPFVGLDHLFQLIPKRLIEEESVFDLICHLVETAGSKFSDANGIVRLELAYHDLEKGEKAHDDVEPA